MTGPAIRRDVPVPVELSAEMTPADIAFELQQLQFNHSEFRRIMIDREVSCRLAQRAGSSPRLSQPP